MTKVILVNYTGGYCGNFLSYLIGESLGTDYTIKSNEANNSYYFQSGEIETRYIKPFGKLFDIRQGFLKMEELELITRLRHDESYTYVMNLYKILYDEDDDVFIKNIKIYYADLMSRLKSKFFITNIHYAFKYKNLLLQDVFKDSIVFYVGTDSTMYARFFSLLFHYKVKDAAADQLLQLNTLNDREINYSFINPLLYKPFDDASIYVDMGKLLFEKKLDIFNVIEDKFYAMTGIELNLDRIKFLDYMDKNIQILENILGKDFLTQSENQHIKKSLEFINTEIKI